ncbi:MAG: flagellar basal body rod protein FlgC [Planctomycetota bacterium]
MDAMRGVFWGFDIAASGLDAEMRRSEIVASNIANMHVTGGPGRDPYRRRTLSFEEVLGDLPGEAPRIGSRDAPSGVRVAKVVEDHSTAFKPRYEPGHPDADDAGFVLGSNVDLFKEMVDMMVVQRSFQANLASLRAYRSMVQSSITNIGR